MTPRYKGRLWRDYPTRYLTAIRHFYQPNDDQSVLVCKDEREAALVRRDVYRLFSVIRKQVAAFAGEHSYDSVECANLAATIPTLMIRLHGAQVVICRRPFADTPKLRQWEGEII